MIRAVLDTNTIVSALMIRGSIPYRILAAAYAVVFVCCSSDVIVREVLNTLGRDRVRRKYPISDDEIERLHRFLESEAVRRPLTTEIRGVATHPEDDLILATAVSAEADYLVTGDRQLLALGSYAGVQIVSPREFLTIREIQGTP